MELFTGEGGEIWTMFAVRVMNSSLSTLKKALDQARPR